MSAADIHNLTLLGPAGAGKTTLVEAVALQFRAIERRGRVEDGTTICDFQPDEKEKRHSLAAAVVHLETPAGKLNLIDTPGYPDFVADAIASMGAAGCAVLVVPARSGGGVPFHALDLWRRASKLGLARAVVVTRLDADNLDLDEEIESIRASLGSRVVPFTLANGTGAAFTAVEIEEKAGSPWRSQLVDAIVEADDGLMAKYLETGEVSDEELEATIPTAMAQGTFAPLFCVDPVRGIGVKEFAEFLVKDFPNARMQLAAMHSANLDHGEEHERAVARVWKVLTDRHLGQISYLRVLQGRIAPDTALLDPRSGKPVKMNGLAYLFGARLDPVARAGPGDIVAVTRIEDLHVGDVLVSSGTAKPHDFGLPEPYASLAVRPRSRSDEQKIGTELQKIAREDPTVRLRRDPVTHQLVVDGLSEMHLNAVLHRLEQRGVGTERELPRIAYKETITAKAEGHHRHKKQSGGRGQFGECFLRIAPRPRGAGFEFVDGVVGGAVPRQFIPAVEKGVREQLEKGVIAAAQIVDVQVELYDGKFHDVDSDEHSFRIAGALALRDAFQKARPILLEPIVEAEIAVPSRYFGDVSGDLNGRRGHIMGMESDGDFQTIRAHVPLAEMQTYATILRSMTHGEGSFRMAPARYEQVPAHLQADLVAKHGQPVTAE
jgi:elongation factor G